MSQAEKVHSGVSAQARTTDEDLSREIVRTVEREKGDEVRCTRICGNRYRCNWWSTGFVSSAELDGLVVTSQRVRKSAFLRVTRTTDGLLIEDLSSRLPAIP